jgi:hypothetical protein
MSRPMKRVIPDGCHVIPESLRVIPGPLRVIPGPLRVIPESLYVIPDSIRDPVRSAPIGGLQHTGFRHSPE